MTTARPDTEPDPVESSGSAPAVLELLRRRLDRPDLAYAVAPQILRGGFYAEIIAIRLAGAPPELSGDLVVRIMPDEHVGQRETIVQREVGDQGFPVPKVRLAGGADDGLGQAYMVMDRVPGSPLLPDLSRTTALLSIPRLARRLPRTLAEVAVRLHRLDPEPIVEALHEELPGTWVDVDDMRANLTAHVESLDDPQLHRATEWMAANRRDPDHRAVCHGDLHPFNVLVDDDGNAVLVDWTNGVVADPAFDLAFTMTTMRHVPMDLPSALVGVARRGAGWMAGRVLSEYRELAAPHGIQVDDDQLSWHVVLMATRMLAELEGWRADGTLADHPGHPFLVMEPGLRADIDRITRPR